VRDAAGHVQAIVEERDAEAATLALDEINAGVYCFEARALWPGLSEIRPSPVTGELYLTEFVNLQARSGAAVRAVPASFDEVRGVNTRTELATAERIARARSCARLMECGVTVLDPATTYIDEDARAGQDTVIYPNTHLCGDTVIGEACEIGPNSIIRSSRIGDGCRVLASVVEESTLEDGVAVGPFSHLRDGAYIESGAYLGNYAEVKKSRIGGGTQMHHFSYAGDATIGCNVNIGAGTITCNYDGTDKHQTVIGDGAFIGSDTMLIAPVTVGAGGRTGAGSVVTKDVPPGGLVLGVPARLRTQAAAGDAAPAASERAEG
jgi:bifunctional UDP-N-acetylglucosamine pyrophosphorylase/glucosamine-1-phosphate N-acetyltransferase